MNECDKSYDLVPIYKIDSLTPCDIIWDSGSNTLQIHSGVFSEVL